MTKRKNNQFYEVLGWVGVVFVLLSYILLATGFLNSESIVYHLLILIGASCIALISYIKNALQPMLLNVIFAVFATYAIGRLLIMQ